MISLRPIVIWAAAVVLLLVGIAQPAFAGDGAMVDFSPIAELVRQYLTVGIDALLGAVLAWALRYLHLSGNVKAEGLAVDAREFLHATAVRGLDRAQKKIAGSISDVDVGNAVIASALAYLQSNARGAVKRLGASPDELRLLLEALRPEPEDTVRPAARTPS